MSIQIKGLTIIVILLVSVGAFPIFSLIPVFAAGSTNSTNSNSVKVNSTSTVTPSANATASKNSTSTAPPSTTPPQGGTVGTPSSGSSPITVTTDKPSYNAGDKITISGSSSAYLSDTPVTIIIRNPIGNVIKVDQIPLGTDRTYSTSVTASGALWQAAGTYSVSVQFGSPDRAAKTTFNFTGLQLPPPPSPTISVDGTNFSVKYTIINGTVLDIKADQLHTSIIISIKTTGDGLLIITLPRGLIDSKNSDGTDKPYVVSNDGNIAQFNETSTTSTDRTLTIPFKSGTQQIAIMGTFVIPEFGQITAMVLAIAIISIIVISSRTWLRFMP